MTRVQVSGSTPCLVFLLVSGLSVSGFRALGVSARQWVFGLAVGLSGSAIGNREIE